MADVEKGGRDKHDTGGESHTTGLLHSSLINKTCLVEAVDAGRSQRKFDRGELTRARKSHKAALDGHPDTRKERDMDERGGTQKGPGPLLEPWLGADRERGAIHFAITSSFSPVCSRTICHTFRLASGSSTSGLGCRGHACTISASPLGRKSRTVLD